VLLEFLLTPREPRIGPHTETNPSGEHWAKRPARASEQVEAVTEQTKKLSGLAQSGRDLEPIKTGITKVFKKSPDSPLR
jgi:hypothetical protein